MQHCGLLLICVVLGCNGYLHPNYGRTNMRFLGVRTNINSQIGIKTDAHSTALSWIKSSTGRCSRTVRMSESSTTDAEEKKAGGKSKADFSSFASGQQYDAEILSAKQYGIFVDISKGFNVLLPKRLLSAGNYNKLKTMADAKSKDSIKIELVDVNTANQTLSGKYIDPNFKDRRNAVVDLTQFNVGQQMNGTVVSTHEFGAFVSLDGFDMDGLLPKSMSKGVSITKGMSLEVKIDSIDQEKKKLVLALTKDASSAAPLSGISPEKWIQGIVTSVQPFGLFVRPAGMDMNGLVHNSRIPRELIKSLKNRVTIPAGANKTDCEALFQAGDVVKVRVNGLNQQGKTELSMLKYDASDEEDDDYVVDGRDPEEEEGKRSFDDEEEDSEASGSLYDPQDTLLWWQGAPYVRDVASNKEVDEEVEVVMENSAVVEGTWRRMFEVDMREDQADFSTKMQEAELKELEEEIGELNGLDDDMFDPAFGVSSIVNVGQKLGNYVSMKSVPKEWTESIAFFKESLEAESAKVSNLRKGKVAEQSEFETLLREVEVELEASAPRQRREVEAAAEPAAEAPAADAPAAE